MNKSFIEKIISIQQELKTPKNEYNAFGKFYYRTCEAIFESLKPLLAEHHLLLNLSDNLEQIEDKTYIKSTATITDGTDSLSSSAYARDPITKSGMDGAQVTGASTSYARKYALNALFLIDDSKDNDGYDNREDKKESTTNSSKREQLIEKAKSLNVNIDAMIKYYKKDSLNDITDEMLEDAIKKKERKNK